MRVWQWALLVCAAVGAAMAQSTLTGGWTEGGDGEGDCNTICARKSLPCNEAAMRAVTNDNFVNLVARVPVTGPSPPWQIKDCINFPTIVQWFGTIDCRRVFEAPSALTLAWLMQALPFVQPQQSQLQPRQPLVDLRAACEHNPEHCPPPHLLLQLQRCLPLDPPGAFDRLLVRISRPSIDAPDRAFIL